MKASWLAGWLVHLVTSKLCGLLARSVGEWIRNGSGRKCHHNFSDQKMSGGREKVILPSLSLRYMASANDEGGDLIQAQSGTDSLPMH